MMLISGRAVFLLLMVFVWAGAAWAAPRVFVLTSGKTVEGEVVFVSRDEATLELSFDRQVQVPLSQLTAADKTALIQWGRTQEARWAAVAVEVKSARKMERSHTPGTKITKNSLYVTATIKNRSAQPLKEVRVETRGVVEKLESAMKSGDAKSEVGSSILYGDIAPGATVMQGVAEVPLKEELSRSSSYRGKSWSSTSESGRDLQTLWVSVYVGPELIYHQRVK